MLNYNHDDTHQENGSTIFLFLFFLPSIWEFWIVLKFGFYLGKAVLRITPWPNLNGCIASSIALILFSSTCITATLIWISIPSLNICHWPYQIATNILAGWILVNIFIVAPVILLYLLCRFGKWLFWRDHRYPVIFQTSQYKNHY